MDSEQASGSDAEVNAEPEQLRELDAITTREAAERGLKLDLPKHDVRKMVEAADKHLNFEPEDHDTIGKCVACGDPVYPANRNQVGMNSGPVMHKGCGW